MYEHKYNKYRIKLYEIKLQYGGVRCCVCHEAPQVLQYVLNCCLNFICKTCYDKLSPRKCPMCRAVDPGFAKVIDPIKDKNLSQSFITGPAKILFPKETLHDIQQQEEYRRTNLNEELQQSNKNLEQKIHPPPRPTLNLIVQNDRFRKNRLLLTHINTQGLALIPGDIPSSVQTLDFDETFNNGNQQLVPGVLPNGLISFSTKYGLTGKGFKFTNGNQPLIPGIFPITIENIVLPDSFTNGNRPIIPGIFSNLRNLHRLLLSGVTNGNEPLQPGIFPSRFTESYGQLELGSSFTNGNQELQTGIIPSNLGRFNLGRFNNGGRPLSRELYDEFRRIKDFSPLGLLNNHL